MAKPQQKPEKDKPTAVRVLDPKGSLPRKRRKPPTGGSRPNGAVGQERYAPGKRLKSAHRKAESTAPLRVFAQGRAERSDWLANKRSTGR